MNVVIQINVRDAIRDAIPVRAIPFLTSWQVLTPDKLADVLANDELDIIGGIRDLKAYRLNGDRNPVAIPASWWLNFPCKELAGLSDRIKAEQSSHADGYTNQWRPQSILKFPAGAFVWRDEFEPKYKRRFRLTQPTFKGEYWPLLDYELPMLDAGTMAVILEGFGIEPTAQSAVLERAPDDKPAPDQDMLATPKELIAAFGLRTGMCADWFKSLRDKPGLMACRRQLGTGGRKHTPPLFDVFAVMNWLVSQGRNTGTAIDAGTAWHLLKKHFPKVYSAYEIGDPNED